MNNVTATESINFFSSLLDALDNQIAVIDSKGTILYVNQTWRNFGVENGASSEFDWIGMNYLKVCGEGEDEIGQPIRQSSDGIMAVISGKSANFLTEYPCDSPQKRRWFMMKISPLNTGLGHYFLISHTDITERKAAEDKAHRLSMSDPLTGLANRRHFDEFINNEWQRAMRSKKPISLLMIDVDCFKEFNDRFGHIQGDICLCKIADELKKYARRPSDLVSRFGGEEFILVLSETMETEALKLAEIIRHSVSEMVFPIINTDSNINTEKVTISIGVCTIVPDGGVDILSLLNSVDGALYQAKSNGRNRIELAQMDV